jgi:hypothetical protein
MTLKYYYGIVLLILLFKYTVQTCTFSGAYDTTFDIAIYPDDDCGAVWRTYTYNDDSEKTYWYNLGSPGILSIEYASKCVACFADETGFPINIKGENYNGFNVAYGSLGTWAHYMGVVCDDDAVNFGCDVNEKETIKVIYG